jgi:septal ring factor EnvC (AmiA/AmiB activator)
VNLEIQGIEKLTHDSYVVQIPRIQPRLQSRLEMLLTIFEQNNFVDDREITKNYTYPVDDEYIKYIVEILHHSGTDPDERVEIEKEQEALRVFDLNFGKLRQVIEEKEKTIEENKKTISEKDKSLTEKERLIEELKRRLEEK